MVANRRSFCVTFAARTITPDMTEIKTMYARPLPNELGYGRVSRWHFLKEKKFEMGDKMYKWLKMQLDADGNAY